MNKDLEDKYSRLICHTLEGLKDSSMKEFWTEMDKIKDMMKNEYKI